MPVLGKAIRQQEDNANNSIARNSKKRSKEEINIKIESKEKSNNNKIPLSLCITKWFNIPKKKNKIRTNCFKETAPL